ncbi:hypothetical protein AB0O91_11795 [Kitasatospora sp. NPDC089797]|uniref:hypothetical protein n=1 Tax=Kitasatospora sp. NPDC089797 TaxID=3155298 RepID=UPI00344418D7
MSSTESPRRANLVCCAAAVGLAAAGLLAVHVPPTRAAPDRPHPVGAAGPATTGAPARQQSGPARTGVRAPLAGPTDGRAAHAPADGRPVDTPTDGRPVDARPVDAPADGRPVDAAALAGGPR